MSKLRVVDSRILVCFDKDYSTLCPNVLTLQFLLLLVYFTEELLLAGRE